jgi:signal transduction histidine kinase
VGDHPGGLRRSIFTRLLAVSVAMAVSVPLLVGGAFVLVLRPALDRALGGLLDAYSELLAASEPDLEAARQAARRLDLSVRYQGPRGAWATDDSSPTLSAVEPRLEHPAEGPARCGPGCRVVLRPDGGAYLLDWHLYDRAQVVHDRMALVLVLVILGLVAAAHEVIRRALSPIRALRRGVASVAAGDLEVELPRQRPDELGALADGFNEMVGRVREMVRSRDQLLRDVSHELRSPLTRMRVALALGEDGEPRRRLERTVAEMEALVSELLELERLRAGRGVELGPHDLVEVVRDAVLAFSDRPPGVFLGALPASRTAQLDPDRVRSVLNNLLENALRHALPDSGPVRVSVEERGATVVVQVEDDGPGVPEEDLPRLFEPFFRVDRSRSRGTGGYGLGLALCRRIMEAHGGAIEARNRPGRGAVLLLTFPG